MKVFKVYLINPNEIILVRDESVQSAVLLVLFSIEPAASEILGISDTPPPLSYRISRCEEIFGSPYSALGKREILEILPN